MFRIKKIYKMIQLQKLFLIVGVLCFTLALTSCDPQKRMAKDFNYFQWGVDSIPKKEFTEYKFTENDLITIQVIAGSLRQEDALLFNQTNQTSTATNALSTGNSTGVALSNSGIASAAPTYQIDMQGYIEMVKIGKIKAAGLTRQELADLIKEKLKDEVVKPLIIVKLAQFKVSVLGEVRRPGLVSFQTDKATILDAISVAGDLTDYGKREDILLMRQVAGKYETFKIDLTNTSFINSAVFQVQQNDIIYVGANITKLKTLNVNPNFQRDFGVFVASVSVLAILLNTYAIIKR